MSVLNRLILEAMEPHKIAFALGFRSKFHILLLIIIITLLIIHKLTAVRVIKKITHVLIWNLKVYYRDHKIPSFRPISKYFIPAYTSPRKPDFSKSHFNVILLQPLCFDGPVRG